MRTFWKILARPQNLALLAAIGAGLAFVWTEVVRPLTIDPPAEPVTELRGLPSPAAVTQNATASEGGAAVVSSGEGSVTVNTDARDE